CVGARLLGDVTADRGGADDGAGWAAQRRDRDRHLYARAVLPQARGLVGLHVLAALESRQDAEQLVGVIGRNDDRDRPADRLRGRVATEALGTRQPPTDTP